MSDARVKAAMSAMDGADMMSMLKGQSCARGWEHKSKFRNSFRSLCVVSWCCLDTVVGPGPSGLGPPKARHVAWRKHCSAIGLPGSTVAVDKSAVGRAEPARPMQPKSIGLRSRSLKRRGSHTLGVT